MRTAAGIGNIIRQLRGDLSLREFAEKCQMSHTTIDNLEKGVDFRTGKTVQTKIATIEKIATACNVPLEYIIGSTEPELKDVRPVKLKKFRMLGEIACGEPIWADEEFETYIEAAANIQADFCLTAKGDSMIGARIHDGDIVFIREQPIVNNGQVAAVIIENEATLKRWYYYPDKKKLMLTPENPAYEPLVYIGEELDQVRCLGLAVCFNSKIK